MEILAQTHSLNVTCISAADKHRGAFFSLCILWLDSEAATLLWRWFEEQIRPAGEAH